MTGDSYSNYGLTSSLELDEDKKGSKSSESNGPRVSNLKTPLIQKDMNTEKPSVNDKKAAFKIPNKSSAHGNKGSSSEQDETDSNQGEHLEDEQSPSGIFNFYNDHIKPRNNIIAKLIAIIVGGILIVYGTTLVTATVFNVASNVIFGDVAAFGAFLILLGALLILAAFGQDILKRTPLKKMHEELEAAEKKTPESNDATTTKDENDNRVDKDNIGEENKK